MRKKIIIPCAAAVILAGILTAFSHDYHEDVITDVEYGLHNILKLETADAKEIGTVYSGQNADEDCVYYEITSTVTNSGQDKAYLDTVFLHYRDDNDYGAYALYDYDGEERAWGKVDLIPAGRSARITEIVELPKDTENVTVSLDREDGNEIEIDLKK